MRELSRTKIVATLGPTTEGRIKELINEGVDVFRLNFSHGTHDEHADRIDQVITAATELKRTVGILGDLQGPKIRAGKIIEGGIQLEAGQELVITTDEIIGEGSRISTVFKALPYEVKVGDPILMDDGLLEAIVEKIEGNDIYCKMLVGGNLTSNKGINLPETDIQSPALTEKDERDLEFIIKHPEIDFVALSFVRKGEDLDIIHAAMDKLGQRKPVISKIEKPSALVDIDAIIEKSDALMVARGDLGVEIPAEQVPIAQKTMIRKCIEQGKPCIVATQMLDSMIRNPRPTRAEASDVANAVLDGASAIMLSGETASGSYPIESVQMMTKIIREVQSTFMNKAGMIGYEQPKIRNDVDALCKSIVDLSETLDIKGIICITNTGKTAIRIARLRPACPIFAFASHENNVLRKLSLIQAVVPMPLKNLTYDESTLTQMEEALDRHPFLDNGDQVILAAALPFDKSSNTNLIKLHTIGKDSMLLSKRGN
ncbi:pyruvate kinase [Lentisphaera profundi]|uniref:Pyruvate kinase n=1 Tax=Lentisphaera profundi TaxID=1658616 RepID=A0ABY7VTZ3_9BACT|nr:pyruvate kinase [Lentisphaera profundi]WDE96743.1 pyruvate kinase [Lentisphaera profundi]